MLPQRFLEVLLDAEGFVEDSLGFLLIAGLEGHLVEGQLCLSCRPLSGRQTGAAEARHKGIDV